MRKVECDYPDCEREMRDGKEFTIVFYPNKSGLSEELQFCNQHGKEIFHRINDGETSEQSINELIEELKTMKIDSGNGKVELDDWEDGYNKALTGAIRKLENMGG